MQGGIQSASQRQDYAAAPGLYALAGLWEIAERTKQCLMWLPGHLGMQRKTREPLPHRAQLTNQIPLPGASSEGQRLTIRAQRQLIRPKRFGEPG